MLCEKCRIREANIKYTEVIGGTKTEHNLCSQCAQEMDFGQYSAIFEGDFTLGKLLSGLLGLQTASARAQTLQDVVCPTCKTTYDEFVKDSRFGCADCYHVFDLLIGERIKKMQESANHTGKQPKFMAGGRKTAFKDGTMEFSAEEEIKQLEHRLKAALRMEEYEEAALCRDRLKLLREGVKNNDEVV